ncbi:hypothetical protein PENSPDRAFT_741498 [Peniophora sp. CONT]|nr:hypothetical protein PENSPDRAFT_741498 [Peniophora sp. CONT]
MILFRLAHRPRLLTTTMAKRARTSSPASPSTERQGSPSKKPKSDAHFVHNKIALADAAANAEKDPPFKKLMEAVEHTAKSPKKGECVVYWMKMEDIRVYDNRALAAASEQAQKDGISLVVLFTISPQDYVAHDRSPRRIDFMLRNLRDVKAKFSALNIPLAVITHSPRRTIPERIMSFVMEVGATHLVGTIEYAVDELRRDIKICELAKDANICVNFVHDKLIIEPGTLFTKQGKPYTVYSPFQKQWIQVLNSDVNKHLAEAPEPAANSKAIKSDSKFGKLFESDIPDHVDGFECEDADVMRELWPAGSDAGREMLRLFMHTKSQGSHVGLSDPLAKADESTKHSRVLAYKENRDRCDRNTTSRLSPYLASGVISVRDCVRATLDVLNVKKVQADSNSGVGVWVKEVAWHDFYTHILATFPRVSMGRNFLEKYDDVQWETNQEHVDAWKAGKTGVPIVDAAMRQANTMGWMHNRGRMIAAMYLVKDLMLDWRLGERYFMQQFIDGDLAANNGGWQWCASTGCDPQPYFRIMNPYLQSEKADPTGEYIRTFVPELSKVFGKDVHNPPAALADKLGYPRPLVDHHKARERAIHRYKNIGEK